MSTFNPEAFEQTVVEQASETDFTPTPKGEYTAYVDDYSWREVNDIPVCAAKLKIIDEKLKELLGQDDPWISYDMFIELEPNGTLAFGPNKNVALGRLREALGQNRAGEPWTFSMLRGAGPVKITVEPDKKQPEKYSRVAKVVAATR